MFYSTMYKVSDIAYNVCVNCVYSSDMYTLLDISLFISFEMYIVWLARFHAEDARDTMSSV